MRRKNVSFAAKVNRFETNIKNIREQISKLKLDGDENYLEIVLFLLVGVANI